MFDNNEIVEFSNNEIKERHAKRRKNNLKKAIRKEKIARAVKKSKPLTEEGWHYYDHLHQYSKNSVDCSDPQYPSLHKTNDRKSKNSGHGFRGKKMIDTWEKGKEPKSKRTENGIVVISKGVPNKIKPSHYGLTNNRKGKHYKISDAKKVSALDCQETEYLASVQC